MGVKVFGFIPPRDGMSLDDFHDHYRHPHGTLGRNMTTMRGYVQSHRVPLDRLRADDTVFEAVAEIWLDNVKDVVEFRREPVLVRYLIDDEPNFVDLQRLAFFAAREEVIASGPRQGEGLSEADEMWSPTRAPVSFKLLLLVNPAGDPGWASDDDLALGQAIGALRHVRCHPLVEIHGTEPTFLGLHELWWPTRTAFERGIAAAPAALARLREKRRQHTGDPRAGGADPVGRLRMGKLEGKVAIVTGGASGIGRASALRMARDGATVVLADIDLAGATEVATEIKGGGARAIAVACDICEEPQIAAAFGKAVETFGRLDIMFNNAAALPQEILMQDIDILTLPTDGWDRLMAGVLRSVMLGCRYAVLQMRKNGGGSIINTSSMYGVSAFNRHPGYGTAKAGVTMLTQYVATAFGREGIRCNAIAPSMIRTALLERTAPEPLIQLNADSALTPALGTPDEVADIVAFLASDDSRYLTAQLIRADGGTTAHLPTYSDAARFFASAE